MKLFLANDFLPFLKSSKTFQLPLFTFFNLGASQTQNHPHHHLKRITNPSTNFMATVLCEKSPTLEQPRSEISQKVQEEFAIWRDITDGENGYWTARAA